jgi:23S rRNA pseudouridine2605 synthase
MSLVPPIPGLVPVGRLDAESEGLLLLTTDGDWAQRVSHPRYGASKEYYVAVRGVPAPETLARLRAPMVLAPGDRTTGAEVDLTAVSGGDARLRMVLHEGRNRQIRRMLDLAGHPVRRLVRVRVGGIRLGRLRPGEWRRLSREEVASVSLPAPSRHGHSFVGPSPGAKAARLRLRSPLKRPPRRARFSGLHTGSRVPSGHGGRGAAQEPPLITRPAGHQSVRVSGRSRRAAPA